MAKLLEWKHKEKRRKNFFHGEMSELKYFCSSKAIKFYIILSFKNVFPEKCLMKIYTIPLIILFYHNYCKLKYSQKQLLPLATNSKLLSISMKTSPVLKTFSSLFVAFASIIILFIEFSILEGEIMEDGENLQGFRRRKQKPLISSVILSSRGK